jgi:hypothetical protein
VVPAPQMATSNHGNKNIIDKAKEYQKRKKNLEIPPCFRGKSFALLAGDNLNAMSKKVNITIGNDVSDNNKIINSLIDVELGRNLQFARDNPISVMPESIDVDVAQLTEHAAGLYLKIN